MSKDGQSPAKWQHVSQRKKDEQYGRIPADWRLKTLPGPNVKSYMDIPRKCGLLTKEELDITENYDAVALAQAIKDKKLKCVDVTRAFCKVSLHPDGIQIARANTELASREQRSPINSPTASQKSSLTTR